MAGNSTQKALSSLSELLGDYFNLRKDSSSEAAAVLEAAVSLEKTVESLKKDLNAANDKLEDIEEENRDLTEENETLAAAVNEAEGKLDSSRSIIENDMKRITNMITAIILHILREEGKYNTIDHEFRFFAEDYLSYVAAQYEYSSSKELKEALLSGNPPESEQQCPSPPFR